MYHVDSITPGAISLSPCLSARMSHAAVDEIYNFFVTIVMYDFRFWSMNGQKIGLRLSVISLARVKQMRLCVKITWWFSNFSGKYRYYNISRLRRKKNWKSCQSWSETVCHAMRSLFWDSSRHCLVYLNYQITSLQLWTQKDGSMGIGTVYH